MHRGEILHEAGGQAGARLRRAQDTTLKELGFVRRGGKRGFMKGGETGFCEKEGELGFVRRGKTFVKGYKLAMRS